MEIKKRETKDTWLQIRIQSSLKERLYNATTIEYNMSDIVTSLIEQYLEEVESE